MFALFKVLHDFLPRKSGVVQKAIAEVDPSIIVVYSDPFDHREEKSGCRYCTSDCSIKELIFPPSVEIDI